MKVRIDTILENLIGKTILQGDTPAIRSESGTVLTFSKLVDQIRQTVDELNGFGISRNDRVAIVLPQSPELATTFLAVSSGVTAAPLNHNYKRKISFFTWRI